MIGDFLRARRERFGFSVHDVASLAGLTIDDVKRAEAGEPLSLARLHALAQALVFDEAHVLRGELVQIPDARRMPGWFRSHDPLDEQASSPRDARLFARAAELGQIGAFLWSKVEGRNLPLDELHQPVSLDPQLPPWQQGYALGAAARLRLHHSTALGAEGPLTSVQALLESLGVHVARIELDSREHQAVSIYRPGAMPVVLLNENHSRVRSALSRRAVLTHELGHLLHDGGERDLSPTQTQATDLSQAVEQRANGFAPAFLAPPDWVKAALQRDRVNLQSHREVVQHIALTWGFTRDGAVWHAKNCGLIGGELAESLVGDHALLPDTSKFAAEFEPQPSRHNTDNLDLEASLLTTGLLQDLVVRATLADDISRGRALEILAMG